jgi:hypothetical protein
MRILRFLTVFLITCVASIALAGYSTKMQPTPDERLDNPIYLSGPCSDVKVVEWRYRPGYSESTGPSPKSIRILKKLCKLAVREFPDFVENKGFKLEHDRSFRTTLSLIPTNSKPRNLNDLKYRFFERYQQFALLGYHHRSTNYTFVMHNVLKSNETPNSKFKTVYVHELYHALANYYGVFHQYSDNLDTASRIDEALAMEFTAHLGLGR